MQAFKIDIVPPLLVFVRERNKKYIFKCIFNLLNFIEKQMAECKIRNFKSFFLKNVEVSVKELCREWEGEFLLKWFFYN